MIAFTDQHCIADPLAAGESAFGMLAFPWIAQDGDLLVMTYHDGRDASTGGDFTTRLKTSADNGVTWTPGRVVWDEGLDSGANITVLAGGDWLMVSQGYTANVASGIYAKRSTDKGATWQPTTVVGDAAFTAGHTYTSCAAVELPGTLLLPVYGSDTGHDGAIAKLMVSVDGGATWTVGSTVMVLPSGIGANEVTIQRLPDGTLAAMVRCTDMVARRTTSADGGVTWSALQTVFTGCNSRIDWLILASGRCIVTYRDSGTSCAMLTYSDDLMVNVADPVQMHGPDKRTSYSSLAEVAPGVVFVALGEVDDTEANGRIMGRYIMEQYGLAPTGQNTYLPAIQRAAGLANVVAWDTFDRPDNAQGLGSADSGQQWGEYGGISSNEWKVVGGLAQCTGSAIHSVTVETRNSDGWIEADLRWSGGTSSPVGLCALRSTKTGHALVAKLDSGGKLARISRFDGSAVADLATTTTFPAGPSLAYQQGVWCRWRLTVRGLDAWLTIDGRFVLAYRLTSDDRTYFDGTRWGLWGGGSGVTYQAKNVIVSA
jgi:hypothetical protein